MAEASTRSVDRALELLGIVCDSSPVALGQAARAANLSTSTALRLLRTLEAHEFVRRDIEGRYAAGPRIVQLGAQVLSTESIVLLANESMARMVEVTGESCYLLIHGAGEKALYIATVEGTHSIRHASWVGQTIPLQGTAAGAVLTGPPSSSAFTLVRQGVEDDVTAIAVPIVVGTSVVAALSIVMPSYRATDDQGQRIGKLLLHEAGTVMAAANSPKQAFAERRRPVFTGE